MLWTGDVDHIDCGQTYYQMGISSATRRRSSSTRTSRTTARRWSRTSPRADPQVSEDGKTVTVKIKQGVKYSPPYRQGSHVRGRQVRDRARLLQLRRQRLHAVLLRGPRGRQGRRQGRHRRSPASTTPDDHDARPEVQARGRRRDGRRRARLRRDRAGARGVRGEVRRRDAVDLRREPARHRPVHDRERRRRARRSATSRASASTWSATRTGTRRSTSSPPTSTRSTTSRATTIRASPRAAS